LLFSCSAKQTPRDYAPFIRIEETLIVGPALRGFRNLARTSN